MRRLALLLALFVLSGCDKAEPGKPAARVELRKLAANLVELVTAQGTPPYCLAFSVAETGVVRQLTMSPGTTSVECEPGRPIGGGPLRIPVREGKVRIHVLFSSQKLDAASVGEQMNDLAAGPGFSVLDLRLPGHVVSETIELTPEPEPRPGGRAAPDPADAGQ